MRRSVLDLLNEVKPLSKTAATSFVPGVRKTPGSQMTMSANQPNISIKPETGNSIANQLGGGSGYAGEMADMIRGAIPTTKEIQKGFSAGRKQIGRAGLANIAGEVISGAKQPQSLQQSGSMPSVMDRFKQTAQTAGAMQNLRQQKQQGLAQRQQMLGVLNKITGQNQG